MNQERNNLSEFQQSILSEVERLGRLQYHKIGFELKYKGIVKVSHIKKELTLLVDLGLLDKSTIKKKEAGRYSTFIYYSPGVLALQQ
jgi:hypothetical protein